MVPLVRAIPAKPALEMLFTGEPISARRALELGLVNRVVRNIDMDLEIKTLTDTIVAMSPLVIRMGKRAYYDLEGLGEAEAYHEAAAIMTENALCRDAQEGISAFLQKRAPHWSGA
jgi:enoyl-CoA hydratase/carnithine racemase